MALPLADDEDLPNLEKAKMMTESSRCTLLQCNKPRKVFTEVVQKVGSRDDELVCINCDEGHRIIDNEMQQMYGPCLISSQETWSETPTAPFMLVEAAA